MSKEYNNESIRRLKGEDRVRERPEALLGSKGLDGAKHTVQEMIGNATDERLAGFGDRLDLEKHEDGSISIRDYGRGVPLGYNEAEQEWNYFLIYEDLYAGGKYDNNQEILRKIDEANDWNNFKITDYPYLISIGLNGLGAAATQYSSEFFEVISYRDGKASRMYYEKGRHVLDELEITDTEEPNGTYIRWKPDIVVFKDVNIPSKWLDKLCKNLSYSTGFKTTFTNKGKTKVYEASNLETEMKGSVDNFVRGTNFVHVENEEGKLCICDAEVVIGSGGRGTQYFHNSIEMNGGAHSSAFNNALFAFFDDVSRDQGVRIKEVDYGGKFSVLVSTLSNEMSLRGQTKDYLDDEYVRTCLYHCMYGMLKTEYQKGTQWLLDIIEETIVNAQNRIAVAEMSKNLRDIERSTKRHKVSNKFVSCDAYDEGKVEEVEWFIVEGDSAGGRVMTARDSKFQCYLAIRGKSLNVYKAAIQQLIANREIKDMIATLGCGIDLGIEGYESFDISKLKVGNIYFLADADIDGKHIKMLLFLIFYRLFPELLYQGKVHIVETPLYVINLKDGGAEFCMDNEELAKKREEIGEFNIHSIDRFKGLGETDADVLWETTLNPATRRTRQLKLERNDVTLCDALEVLFGKSTDRRKYAILGSMMEGLDETLDNIESVSEYIESLGLNSELEVEEIEY